MQDDQCKKILNELDKLILPKLRDMHIEPSVNELVISSTQKAYFHVKGGKNILDDRGELVPIIKDYIFCKLLESFMIHPPQHPEDIFQDEKYFSDVVSYDFCKLLIKSSDKIIESLKDDGIFLYQYGCFIKNEVMCKCDNSIYNDLVKKVIPEKHIDFTMI